MRRLPAAFGLLMLVLAGALLARCAPRGVPIAAHRALGHGPPIVLVHGLGSTPDHWLAVAERLAPRFRVILVELPGHGQTPMPRPFTLERAAWSVGRAIDAETHEPVVLVGHSVGGLVAARLAIERPSRVRALALVETALAPQESRADREAILGALATDVRGVLHGAYLGFGRDSAEGERLYQVAAAQDTVAMAAWIRLAVTGNLARDGDRLRMPVLAVVSDRTWPPGDSWPATADTLGYARIPRLSVRRIGDTGHFVMLDQPDSLADAIAAFAAGAR